MEYNEFSLINYAEKFVCKPMNMRHLLTYLKMDQSEALNSNLPISLSRVVQHVQEVLYFSE